MGPYLLVPVPHISCSPFAILSLHPKEAKPTIALGVCLAVFKVKSLSDGGFHFCHGTSGLHVNVGASPMAAMHNEGAIVHSFLRCRNKIKMVGLARPGGVDICIWVENGFQILPLTSIAIVNFIRFGSKASRMTRHLPIRRPSFGQLSQLVTLKDKIIRSVIAYSLLGPRPRWESMQIGHIVRWRLVSVPSQAECAIW